MMRKRTRTLSAFALFAALLLFAGQALAKPPGLRYEDIGKKLFSFNVLVYPGYDFGGPGNDGDCGNSGHRIFFNEDSNNRLGVIHWAFNPDNNPDFDITDCDGTVDDDANIVVNESLAIWVAIRLVGPYGSALTLVCDDIVDGVGEDPTVGDQGPVDDLCIIGQETIRATKGSSFTKFMRNVVEGVFEDVTWTLDNSTKAKNLQVWIMEDLSQ